jgi:hypothetical protein
MKAHGLASRWRRALVVVSILGAVAIAPGARADANSGGLKPDVRLLIDISGSMKQSDPENLRAPALDLIVRLLPDGSRAGVWIFGEDVRQLIEHRVVDAAWREEAQRAVAEIDNSGQRTNIPAALAAATYDLDRIDPNYRVSIILLTDGKVDVSESPMVNARAARSVLTRLAPDLGATGIPVHTIALSDEADWRFLRSLARSTDGVAEKAITPAELTAIYLHSLEMVAPAPTVPVEDNTFLIDDSVEEFTALVFFDQSRNQVGLVSPGGVRFGPAVARTGVEWFRNQQFALVTVADPEPGTWRLRAPGSKLARITVIADLQLEADPMPNNLPAGQHAELGLRLREGSEIISDAEVLRLFALRVDIEGSGGFQRSVDVSADYPVPANGEYRVAIAGIERPGRYQVTARLDGKTLQRQIRLYVEVTPSAATSSISTRGEALPPVDFRTPALVLGSVVLLLAALVYWYLRRRRLRRLELWRRRSRETAANDSESGLLVGLRAPSEERKEAP